jgi:hypothetical protein
MRQYISPSAPCGGGRDRTTRPATSRSARTTFLAERDVKSSPPFVWVFSTSALRVPSRNSLAASTFSAGGQRISAAQFLGARLGHSFRRPCNSLMGAHSSPADPHPKD